MDATRRAKACLDNSCVSWEVRVEANILVVQQCEICPAVCGFPHSERRKTRSGRDSASAHRADAAHAAIGRNVKNARVAWINDDRGDRTAIESRPAIRGCDPITAMPNRASAINTCPGGNTRICRKMRPGIAAVGGFVNSKARLRVTRGIWLAGSSVQGVVRSVISQSPDRIRRKAAGHKRPIDATARKRLVRAPDSAACRCRPTRHLLVLQLGSTASAVMRPEVVYAAPLKVRTSGKFAVLGPARVQPPSALTPLPGALAMTLVQALWALRVK